MENQIVIVVTEEQYHIIVNALNDLRTRCINENIDSTDVDYLLLDVIDSKKSKDLEKVKSDGGRYAR